MRALFVQHDHASPTGPVGDRFRARGYEVEELLVVPEDRFHAPDVTASFPDPTGYDAVVAMGAPWSVYDRVTIGTWIDPELEFLRGAQKAGVPMLGICFGAQALAAALGGSVELAATPEIGWHRVHSDEPGLVEEGPWFEWHYDRWVAPPGARVIAHSRHAEQAFVVGRSLAVQFHPEFTSATLHGWLANGGTAHLNAHQVDIDALTARTAAEDAHAARRAETLVDRFLELVAGVSSNLAAAKPDDAVRSRDRATH